MAYDTVLNIVSDASVEVGLGAQTVVYANTDANVVQLRYLLKSAGRKLLMEHDWTHLCKEATLVTFQAWAASTTYVTAASAVAWATNTAYVVGDLRKNAGNLYKCTTAGTSNSVGPGPNTQEASIADGSACIWKFLNAGAASIVTHGYYSYTCTTAGTTGTIGPYNTAAGTETDGTVVWTWLGRAADFALPTDFSQMIDQTNWNRTNRLPTGGPMSAQEWQYMKGRAQGVVFNVLFRPVAGLLRLFPDKDTPAGYMIAYEYQSTFWASATGGTSPTLTVPTADSDIIYFDPTLMTKRVKLEFLRAKGLPSDAAERDYEEILELVLNGDRGSPVINLGGRGAFEPLLGNQSVPVTGFGGGT